MSTEILSKDVQAAFVMLAQTGKPNICQEENEQTNCDISLHEIILNSKK